MVEVKELIKGLEIFQKNYNYIIFPCLFFIYLLICISSYGNSNSNVFAFQATVSSDSEILTIQGTNLSEFGKYDEAIAHFDKALAIDPTNQAALYDKGHALVGKGIALNSLGNYNAAITYLDKALAIDPNDEFALKIKGNALYSLGNYSGSMTYYDKFLAIEPNDKDALAGKNLALEKLNNNTQNS